MAEGLDIVLEFARAEATGNPHAFRFAPQSYIVRTPRGGFGSSELGWDAALLEKLAVLQGAGVDPPVIAELGELLRSFLAPTGWELLEQQISSAVQQRRPVHLTVRSAAAELFALPWELLTLRATGQSLGGLPGVLVRYEWPETGTAPPSPTSGPDRVLVAWSAAGGGVPAADHLSAIRAAGLAPEVLANASPTRLADELARATREGRPIAALHLLCHGGKRGQVFGLVLDGEADGDASVLLDPARLQQILAPHLGTLRLVVLSACNSGHAGELGTRLGSTAQMLHRAGLAAVVASRYPLSIAGSVRMTAAFYEVLAAQGSLEPAFLAARAALGGDATTLDWASVQLYARADDEPLVFRRAVAAPVPDVREPVVTPQPRRSVAPFVALGGVVVVLVVAWLAGLFGPAAAPPEVVAQRTEVPPAPVVTPPEPTRVAPPVLAPEQVAPAKDPPPEPPKDPPKDPPKKVIREPAAPTSTRPSGPCPAGLRSYLQSMLRDGGGRVVKVTLRVGKDGGVTPVGADAGVTAARIGLRGGNAADVRRHGGDALPCHLQHEWALAP